MRMRVRENEMDQRTTLRHVLFFFSFLFSLLQSFHTSRAFDQNEERMDGWMYQKFIGEIRRTIRYTYVGKSVNKGKYDYVCRRIKDAKCIILTINYHMYQTVHESGQYRGSRVCEFASTGYVVIR